MTGTIVNLQFGSYGVFAENEMYLCHLLKTDKMTLKPVVGDHVALDSSRSTIIDVLPRQSFIRRPRIANLTDLIIVSSLVEPTHSFYLTAMFLTFARFYNLHVTVVITKTDQEDFHTFQTDWDYLIQHDIPVIAFRKDEPDFTKLKTLVSKGKVVAFAGQTGVGKSTLINTLDPFFARKIGTYSQALGRGKHQTKEVVLFPFQDGLIADTPGFSSLVLPMVKQEAAKVFPGFENVFSQCKFFNCTHEHEPDCHIQALVNRGKIPLSIYQDYLKLISKLPEQKEYE